MGIKFGEIDAAQILQNEFNIMVLQRFVERLTRKNPTLIRVDQPEFEEIKKGVATELSKKYPKSGIEYKP